MIRLVEGSDLSVRQTWLLTVDETAALLRTSRKAIYVMVERGKLPGVVRIGKRILFRRVELMRWLDNLWRRLVLPKRIESWSLTSLQQRLVKTGGRLIKHARYYWLLLAESHLTRRLFGSMVRRIAALPVPAG